MIDGNRDQRVYSAGPGVAPQLREANLDSVDHDRTAASESAWRRRNPILVFGVNASRARSCIRPPERVRIWSCFTRSSTERVRRFNSARAATTGRSFGAERGIADAAVAFVAGALARGRWVVRAGGDALAAKSDRRRSSVSLSPLSVIGATLA